MKNLFQALHTILSSLRLPKHIHGIIIIREAGTDSEPAPAGKHYGLSEIGHITTWPLRIAIFYDPVSAAT